MPFIKLAAGGAGGQGHPHLPQLLPCEHFYQTTSGKHFYGKKLDNVIFLPLLEDYNFI
jgi:hypothetical protein